MKQTWMIRAEGGQLIDMFLSKNITAIGWYPLGDLSKYDKDSLLSKIEEKWPQNKPGRNRNILSVLFRFANEVKKGDTVITYDPSRRVYHLGEIVSEYQYDSTNDEWPNIRKVKWEKEISRDRLSTNTKNTLGSTLTLFKVPDEVVDELHGKQIEHGEPIKHNENDIEEDFIFEDYQAKSIEFIKDKISNLDWEELQRLVAGLLRAMGYKTKISPRGSDLGKDIVASPDGFGLEQPRIVVEVKHRQGSAMGSQEIRSFLGGRHKDDKGLYVSTGGFTKDAKYEADRASIPLTLMDIDSLVFEILNNYEQMDVETKMLLPLKKVYWPK
ncbi:MAG: restriction endonuclease [Melioribacteraceae bacterium]|nr:restriction endonuclease [Melioribacteraceae bacterium]MCF8354851.1 restriction endonuclease [Melioribacteraceae bacterium]MCF8392958.1 restriction endonuclease [Melioribacteraceae bacterium]MCF8417299.1 restriction endonuclease [Melioribacteraceae bacterium]